ncbi:MAG: prepilin-type N-terminal cleavage/methylation domain-containing protein [Cyanobacteriota bacterium]
MFYHNRRKNGFTLIELLITISLISVLTILSFNNYAKVIDRQNTINASKDIIYALNKARYYSKTKGKVTHIDIPIDSNKYYIDIDGNLLYFQSESDEYSGILPANTKVLQNSCGEFFFYIDGTPMTNVDTYNDPLSNICRIIIGNNDNDSKTLLLNPYSGSIEYEE